MTIPTGPGAGHGHNLLGPQPTYLPESPGARGAARGGRGPGGRRRRPPDLQRGLGGARRAGRGGRRAPSPPTPSRAPATTAGLDQLRRNGWKGFGPVPWDHEPNQGFLRAVAALARAAEAIGETDEVERCVHAGRRLRPAARSSCSASRPDAARPRSRAVAAARPPAPGRRHARPAAARLRAAGAAVRARGRARLPRGARRGRPPGAVLRARSRACSCWASG